MASKEPEERTEEFLANAPLFSKLSGRNLKRIAELCIPREYDSGTVIVREGDTGLGLFIITSGTVDIFKGDGEERLSLAVLEPGDIMGEMALIDNQPRSATAVAHEPVRALLITRDSFQTLVKKDPEIAWCLAPALAERIRDLEGKIIGEKPGQEPAPEDGQEASPTDSSRDSRGDGEEGKKDGASDFDGGIREMARIQYALSRAGASGLRETARLLDIFLGSLAGETGLNRDAAGKDLLQDFPRGVAAAAGDVFKEAEKLPERMLSTYRRHRRRENGK